VGSAQARNAALGASTSQAYDSAVAEVGLMLSVSARTAAARVNDPWSLSTRLRGALAELEHDRITRAKARILDAETLNLSDEHAAQVQHQVLGKARRGDALVDLVLGAPRGIVVRAPAPPASTPPGNRLLPAPVWPPPVTHRSARGGGALAGRISGSPSPTQPCSVPITSRPNWPVTGRSRRRWPENWLREVSGGASSPTLFPAGRWTMGLLGTGRLLTLPNW
jgi:hypothetical protein